MNAELLVVVGGSVFIFLLIVSRPVRYLTALAAVGAVMYFVATPPAWQQVQRLASTALNGRCAGGVADGLYGLSDLSDDEPGVENPAGVLPGDYDDVDEDATRQAQASTLKDDAAQDVKGALVSGGNPVSRLLRVAASAIEALSAPGSQEPADDGMD